MELWRKVWRTGLAPQLSTQALVALATGLAANDESLVQGATTFPPDLPSAAAEVCAACAVGYCGWKGLGLRTVSDVSEFFARTCLEADAALGEPAACRHFLDWFDHTPRESMRRDLVEEVHLAISQRYPIAA